MIDNPWGSKPWAGPPGWLADPATHCRCNKPLPSDATDRYCIACYPYGDATDRHKEMVERGLRSIVGSKKKLAQRVREKE